MDVHSPRNYGKGQKKKHDGGLDWRAVTVALPNNLDHSGFGFLEVIPANSYELLKSAGGMTIKSKGQSTGIETPNDEDSQSPTDVECTAKNHGAGKDAHVGKSHSMKRKHVDEATGTAQPKRKRAKKAVARGTGGGHSNGALGPLQAGGLSAADVLPEWLSFGLHPILLSNIARLGYARPTRVQSACLPPALSHFKDVVGAAQTGSGKTAAYALPIVQRLLDRRERLGMGTVRPGVSIPVLEEDGQSIMGEVVPVPTSAGWTHKKWRHVAALVLAPTRELAVQVRDHIAALCAGTCISVVTIVGGLAPAKQDRMLRSHPDIVVATPGRLWDMVNSGKHASLTINGLAASLQFMVLDEADRLTEKGHFTALTSLLAAINAGRDESAGEGAEAEAEADIDPEAEAIIAEKYKKNSQMAQDMDDGDDADENEEDEEVGGPAGGRRLKGTVPDSLLADVPAHYRRQTLLFSATLGVATAENAKDAAAAVVRAQIASNSGEDGAKLSKKAFKRALAKAATMTPVEALMARVGLLGRPTVIRVAGSTAAGAAGEGGVNDADEVAAVEGGVGTTESCEENGAIATKKRNKGTAKSGASSAADLRSAIPASVALPSGLRLARITCTDDSKDPALVYFLAKHPGRTLVFVNAISTLRRLSSLLLTLHLPVQTLHAHMQQKQRLAHLEAFRSKQHAVLVATDVAARGLDIPAVQHVLHYALPPTAETFVHRCGRTARGTATGLSVALIGPKDSRAYHKLAHVLAMTAGLPEYPVDARYLKAITSRVSMARKISDEQSALDRDTAAAGWLADTAAAAGLSIDDATAKESGGGLAELEAGRSAKRAKRAEADVESESGDEVEVDVDRDMGVGGDMDEDARAEAASAARERRKRIADMRVALDAILVTPLLPPGTSHRYVTANPALGQSAHPLQAAVRVAALDEDGATRGLKRSRSALVAPRVELPSEVVQGLQGPDPSQSGSQGRGHGKPGRGLSMVQGGGGGRGGAGTHGTALDVLAQRRVHAHIPGLHKSKVAKRGLELAKGGR